MSDARRLGDQLWAAYFNPETFDPKTGSGVLRNRYSTRDSHELAFKGYQATARRAAQLWAGAVEVARTFDADQLRAITGGSALSGRELFEDRVETRPVCQTGCMETAALFDIQAIQSACEQYGVAWRGSGSSVRCSLTVSIR